MGDIFMVTLIGVMCLVSLGCIMAAIWSLLV